MESIYLVTGIDVGKLRATSALVTAGGLLVSAGLRRVVVGMAGVASGGCEYAVIVHISVYRETAYLGSGRESGDEAHVVDCPVEVGKVAFVAALHDDVDDAAYALGIVFGSRRGDDLYALDKFGGQRAQDFLGMARHGGAAPVLQDEEVGGAIHLDVSHAVDIEQRHLVEYLRGHHVFGVRVGSHIVCQLVHIHGHEGFLGEHLYLVEQPGVVCEQNIAQVDKRVGRRHGQFHLCRLLAQYRGGEDVSGLGGRERQREDSARVGHAFLERHFRLRLLCHDDGGCQLGLVGSLVAYGSGHLARGRLGVLRHCLHRSQHGHH